ncbi:uncharacterized protein LOC113665653 [Pocillopora damicornis]|uniref:uncharacterized protein LOC113665653 n=1 Tax=Pocillopora damicornis TaxID=46731 RepID=UPI000F554646|nr:uncharacterized protein LOC113665653 [Pocillopora damicornis]
MNQSSGNQRFAYQQPIGQAPPGQLQPMYVQAQAPPGQYAQQPVGQAVQPAAAQEPTLPKTTDYWNSALIAERVVEFLFLSAAWISIVRYSNAPVYEVGRVNFFKGITVFCWIVSIVFQVGFVFGFNYIKRLLSRPSHLTIVCFIVHIILTILLVACTLTLVFHAHDMSKAYDALPRAIRMNLDELYLALIFGFLVCFSFFESIRLFYKMIVTQRGEEETDNTAQTAQGPGIQSSAM